MDLARPFPVTEDGNKYLMVVSDYFSKWPEAYAIPNQEATTIATMLTTGSADLGSQWNYIRAKAETSSQTYSKVQGIRKTRTTLLHPQSDGMVERFNRTMEEHLSKVVAEHQKDWDRHLPLFLLAYRSAVHDTTG